MKWKKLGKHRLHQTACRFDDGGNPVGAILEVAILGRCKTLGGHKTHPYNIRFRDI